MLEWKNGQCGCVELVEYIPFDNLHVAFGVWIKKLLFFKLLSGRAHTTVTTCYSNPSPPLITLKHAPSPACAATKPFAVRTKKGRGRRRGEERGSRHAAVRRHCSPPKTGRIYSPLSIFPHLHGFSSLFVVVPPCVLQFGAIEGLP